MVRRIETPLIKRKWFAKQQRVGEKIRIEKDDPTKWADIAPRFIPEEVLVDFDTGKLNPEDEIYYKQFRADKMVENIARNEKLKQDILSEEVRIDPEYQEYDNRYYPCMDHQEPQCELCRYNDEEMIKHSQQTHEDAPEDSAANVENISTRSIHNQSTSSDMNESI